MYHLTRPSSPLDRILVPRFVRMYLALWLIRRWRLPVTPALTRPVAVKLKRFWAPDFVFILGILRVLIRRLDGLGPSHSEIATACLLAGRSGEVGSISGNRGQSKRLKQSLTPSNPWGAAAAIVQLAEARPNRKMGRLSAISMTDHGSVFSFCERQ